MNTRQRIALALGVLPLAQPMNARERIARALGLWPVYGRLALSYYTWAQSEISPTHPDAFRVGRRFSALVREFGPCPLFSTLRKVCP